MKQVNYLLRGGKKTVIRTDAQLDSGERVIESHPHASLTYLWGISSRFHNHFDFCLVHSPYLVYFRTFPTCTQAALARMDFTEKGEHTLT